MTVTQIAANKFKINGRGQAINGDTMVAKLNEMGVKTATFNNGRIEDTMFIRGTGWMLKSELDRAGFTEKDYFKRVI